MSKQKIQSKTSNQFDVLCATLKSGKATQKEKILFQLVLEQLKITGFDAPLKDGIIGMLKSDGVEHQKLFPFWRSLINFDPLFKPLVAGEDCRHVLSDEFLVEGLRKLRITDQTLEHLFTALRKSFLLDFYPKGLLKTKDLPFLCALAENCFCNDYVFCVEAKEKEAVASLSQEDAIAVALKACYEAPTSDQKLSAVAAYRRMMTLIVHNVEHENKIKTELETIGSIQDDVSKNVRHMYEENPYPKWRSADMPPSPRTGMGHGRCLIAGCGTGRPLAQSAKVFSDISFTAIDISKSSLAYARRMAEQYNADNISFFQCDILNLSNLPETFDFVECSGVLHHMKDPMAGWRKLIEKLKPGGRMLICLYSTKARRVIEEVRKYIKEKGYPTTLEGIRTLRQDMFALPDDHPLKPVIKSRDFYSVAEARDLVFHVQEKTYDVPELKKMLEELDLEFLGFKIPSAQMAEFYAKRFPDDPSMTNLENWDVLETECPGIFAGMYKIICGRKNEPEANEVFRFMEESGFLKF